MRTLILVSCRIVVASVMTLLGCAAPPSPAGPPPPPNIILFLADDMGVGDTSAYQDLSQLQDKEQIATPSLERLAAMGVRFTDAHSPAATCRPTRRGILTGEFNRRAFGTGGLLPETLRRGGYRTYGSGKWHLPFEVAPTPEPGLKVSLGPLSFGFDHYVGTKANVRKSSSYFVDRSVMTYDEKTRRLRPQESYDEPGYDRPGGPREEISQQLWIDYARRWLADHLASGRYADQPFFLYYASHASHENYRTPELLDGIAVQGAASTRDGRRISADRDGLVQARAEMVHENDVALGLLLAWLEENGDPRNPGHAFIENTLFVFTSDNGAGVPPGSPAHGVFAGTKGQLEEAGHRVPLIASWGRRLPPAATAHTAISGVDLFATFAGIAGIEVKPDEAVDSFDVIDVLRRPEATEFLRPSLPTFYFRSVRLGGFKGIFKPNGSLSALYDLGRDIREMKNLAGLPQYAAQEAAVVEARRRHLHEGRTRPR